MPTFSAVMRDAEACYGFPAGFGPRHGPDGAPEPFEGWYATRRAELGEVPEEVAREWLHRHWSEAASYAWLDVRRLSFLLESWPTARCMEVTFGSGWGECPDGIEPEPVGGLPGFMLAHGTWPSPIIVVPGAELRGLKGARADEEFGPLHLVEGHQRLSHLRWLAVNAAPVQTHEVYLARVAT